MTTQFSSNFLKARIERIRTNLAALEKELADRSLAELELAKHKAKEKADARKARALAKKHGIEITTERDVSTIWVYPPEGMYPNEELDPWYDHHYVDTWEEVLERVNDYIQRKA